MTKLKYRPELVPLIKSGEKTATWRIDDDKGLHPRQIISQYGEDNPDFPFSEGIVTEVIKKPFGDLTEEDKKGHEEYGPEGEMYRTFNGYYPDRKVPIGPETEVTIAKYALSAFAIKYSDDRAVLLMTPDFEDKLYDAGLYGR